MNGNRFARVAAALGMLVAFMLALPAQAQFDCAQLKEFGVYSAEEQIWWFYNCIHGKINTSGDDDGPHVDDEEPETVSSQTDSPPANTCPALPASVVVTGYVEGTQCQIIGTDGIGRMDLIERGFISAVDIWGYVNGGVDVCFSHFGALVFLDAAYVPRMLMDLASFERDGMTCGAIDRVGTVVLLRAEAPAAPAAAPAPVAAPSPAAPAAAPAQPTLPTFDAVPLHNCLIKLVETLFLRAEPAGEIIGLVWLNSEVPAFEINGYWYKIEFEGRTGYISRFYRRVLRGGCG